MTKRERSLLHVVVTVGGFILLGGGFMLVTSLQEGLEQKDQEIEALRRETMLQRDKVLKLAQAQSRLQRYKALSLPPDTQAANLLYRQFLQDLCWRCGLEVRQMSSAAALRIAPAAATPLHTPLGFQVQLEGTLAQLVNFLKEFYAAPLPHQVRDMSIAPRGTSTKALLEISLRIEALQLPNADAREFLLALPDARMLCLEAFAALQQKPTGLALGVWSALPSGPGGGVKLASHATPKRNYSTLAAKNIFMGLAAPVPAAPQPGLPAQLDYIQVTSIISGPTTTEASLRNQRTNQKFIVRAEDGFDDLEIRGTGNQVLLHAKVKAINARKMLLQEGDKYCILRVGQFLSEREEKEQLSVAELKEFRLPVPKLECR